VREAIAAGSELIIAHHPLFLRPIHGIDLDQPKGRVVAELLAHQMSLYVAHTNADLPAGGVAESMAMALGVIDPKPLSPRPARPLDKVITFVPHDRVQPVIDALAAAGAGAIGSYGRCAFTNRGQGTFRPLAGSHPFLGEVDRVEVVEETRLEMVLPRTRRTAVVRALLAAHPYETPAYDVFELAGTADSDSGLGRVGSLATDLTLEAFVRRITQVLPGTPGGIRVAGDLDRPVRTVAVQAGAGDDLLEAARQAKADVYVTSDLRHHPASEAQAWPDAPALVEVSHWAAEWTWLPVAERRIAAALEDQGVHLSSRVSGLCTDPWNHVFDARYPS
jgi:dinuclear metal center YbgI/SA1388 family protein